MNLRVADLMMTKFVGVGPKDLLWEVMLNVAEDRETLLACVVDEDNRLVGVITPRKFLKAVQISQFGTTQYPSLEWGEVLSSLTSKYAEDIMDPPASVKPDQPVEDAISIMLDKSLYELPVVGEGGKVLGEINFFHILIAWAEEMRTEQESATD